MLFDVAIGGMVFNVVVGHPSVLRKYFPQRWDEERRKDVGRPLYHLREQDAGEMSPLLRSLINAYRPHTEPNLEGLTPKVTDSFMDELSAAA